MLGAMSIAEMLSGGDPKTLHGVDEVLLLLTKSPAYLGELFSCLFNPDEIVRLRAGDALEKVFRDKPELAMPYIEQLLDDVAQIYQPSVQWHLAQILGEVELTVEQRNRAVKLMKRNLETASDWIVLNYSLSTMAKFAREDSALCRYLVSQLHRLVDSPRRSVAHRSKKLLLEFD